MVHLIPGDCPTRKGKHQIAPTKMDHLFLGGHSYQLPGATNDAYSPRPTRARL